jgi:hypothetical protein
LSNFVYELENRFLVYAEDFSTNAGKVVYAASVPPRKNLIQPLPLPGSPGAPYFDGKNVTAFIQLIEDLFEDCQIPFHERRAKIVRFEPKLNVWKSTGKKDSA